MSDVGDTSDITNGDGDVAISQLLDALAIEIEQMCERMRDIATLLKRGMLHHGAGIVRDARDELLEVPVLIRYRA